VILLDPLARPVIAHRGASGSFPENTLLAFREALAAGADAFELDVHVTADGVPVVIHDDTVDRTTDGTGAVAQLPHHALGDLDAGRGERIPTLQQVLETFDGTPLIVEMKTVQAANAVVRVLRDAGAGDRVLVGSFLYRAVARARRARLATSASRPETSVFWAASRMRLSVPMPIRAFTVPQRSGRLRVVDERFVRAAQRRGLCVHVWTVDDRAQADVLWTLGVAGIITNFPDRLVRLP
jgi:glycerophosphoryl diester phosphodiesterase